jgi:hypothetical protein
LATQTRAPRKNQARLNQLNARVLRQPTTAVHASHAQQKLAHRHHVGKTALRAPSIAMHAQHATHVIHVTLAQQPVATSVATGAQHLLHVAASFRPTTAHHAELVTTVRPELLTAMPVRLAMGRHHVASKIDLHAPSTATHARHAHSIVTRVRLVTTVHHALSIAMHAQRATRVTAEHLVVSKTDLLALSTATLVRPASSKTDLLALSTATHAQRATIVHRELSTATHVRLATHAMAAHAQRLALSTAQNHADLASSMTALASSTATTAMTAPTVAQTALTV